MKCCVSLISFLFFISIVINQINYIIMKKVIVGIFLFLSYNVFGQINPDDMIITTRLSETFRDKNGDILTGKGVVIGDLDSGVDVFHPMFFFADGGDYNWIDVNGDGKFTPGEDAVDLNKDGVADKEETLRYIEMSDNTFGMLGTNPRQFEVDMDFLYNDANNNRKRDFGTKDGFTEQDPTYGELLFIVLDTDGNNALSVGEKITALNTSKVCAVREKDGTVRRRGVDLILTEKDSIGHGTQVAGIVMGGHYGVQKVHGIAPDAEMIFANIKYDYTPRFVKNFPDLVGFMAEENPNILLFEDGEWCWEFMDGSTEEERLTTQMALNGTIVIGGAGNLADGKMHIYDKLQPGDSRSYIVECPSSASGKVNDGVFPSILWREPDVYPVFTVETPDGQESEELKDGSGFIRVGDYNIFYSRDVSSKGTAMFRFGFSEKDSGSVKGEWKIKIKTDKELEIQGFVVDVSQGWDGNSHWKSGKLSEAFTVTFPSTADSLISTGAYVVNFAFFPGDEFGGLASYSGRGPLINGRLGVDIVAPGHTTFSPSPDYGYDIFSGTSSAAPHVVGAAALMLQYDNTINNTRFKQIIYSTAAKDKFTGNDLPNNKWGYGKLNIEGAIRQLISGN
jgi:subtilisin family serine protease